MHMKHITTFTFEDRNEHCEGAVIVRSDASHVAVAFSLKSDGDILLVMPHEAAKKLQAALETAVSSDT